MRAVDDPDHVMIDLQFDSRREADALLAAMRETWSRADHVFTARQQARIAEIAESRELATRARPAGAAPPG